MQKRDPDEMPEMARSSSFARSFFQSGGQTALDAISGDGAPPAAAAAPARAARPDTQSLGNFRRNQVSQREPGYAAKPSPEEQRARNSWYQDAMNQGGTMENLEALLGEQPPSVAAAAEDAASGFDDEEVLEQYRIMAQHEATLRVKENTGFDMVEYEKRRKTTRFDEGESKPSAHKPKQRLPEFKTIAVANLLPKPKEPTLPPARPNRYFMEQKTSRVPELCPGIVVRGGVVPMPADEHTVRCLGCRAQLRVKMLATLVSCPDCNTVSPASSTRR